MYAQDFTGMKEVGRGSFGRVYLARYFNGDRYAVKELMGQNLSATHVNAFWDEARMMLRLGEHSRHVVQVLGVVGATQPGPLAVVMDFMSRGSMADVIHDRTIRLSWGRKINMALGFCKGVAHMHSLGVVHRDIKSLNVMVNSRFETFIGDFGFAIDAMDVLTGPPGPSGSFYWKAPELMGPNPQQACPYAADVYAIGATIWELTARKLFLGGTKAQTVIDTVTKGSRDLIPWRAPVRLQDLIADCWAQLPARRPDMDQVVYRLMVIDPRTGLDENFVF
jgi:serine/threonine protein kinase